MKVKTLINKLKKLPPECEIEFMDYNNSYKAEVKWDITMEEYNEGYEDTPYIWLTEE